MIAFFVAAVFVFRSDALLFPLNNGAGEFSVWYNYVRAVIKPFKNKQEGTALLTPGNSDRCDTMKPEPELIFACPPPRVPQFGSIKCDYGIFDMSCTAQCDNGFQFEDGSHTASIKCDLFEGTSTPDVQKCVRIGAVSPTDAPGVVVTGAPSTAQNCVRSLSDCFRVPAGDYAYCDNCRMFATCAGSGFYVRNCPGISVFNAENDRCQDNSPLSCRLI